MSDADKIFHMTDQVPYKVDVNHSDNYWWDLTLYKTEVYNFNINYNSEVKQINLWINAPVFDDDRKPIGMVGFGIYLTTFIDIIYRNVGEKTEMFFFNGLGEITGARDIDLITNKVSIKSVLNDKGIDIFAEADLLGPGEIKTFDANNGKLVIGTIPLLEWYMVAFMADSLSDYNTAMTALFLVVLVLILLIFIIFNGVIAGYLKSLRETMESLKVASEAKSHFIANMSHEMRTPMNVIVGLTDLMLEEDELINPKESLKKINTAGTTLMGLINDVLDISKIESGKQELNPVQYEVASFINDIVTLNIVRIAEKPIVFKLEIGDDMPKSLFGDDLRVKQILNNLLSNAFKYTREGSVTLSVTHEMASAVPQTVWVTFSVSDTGMGIREEDIKKLFSDYNQVDTSANRAIEGTGLGLSITKKFVEMMGGEITVESEYGKWTKFRVRIRQGFVDDKTIGAQMAENLRALRYTEGKKKSQGKMVRADLSHAKVLVVDDFPMNLDVASGMLRKYKMQVDCVQSGQEAIDCIKSGDPLYNAIFMDHMMPGMDGVQATLAIRNLGTEYAAKIPIVALTANAVAGNERMFLDNGFNAFLPKPFNAMNLDAVVKRWVGK
jgi:signal transduction histidine kinase